MTNASRVIASIFALTGFVVALVAGAAAGNRALSVVLNALLAMLVCQVVGSIAGAVLARVGQGHVNEATAEPAGAGRASHVGENV